MDKNRRKELLEQYKQIKTYMGAVKITNTVNNRMFIAVFPNLKNKWLTMQAQLDMGQHPNSQLQKDWKELGAKAFTYEVLEEKEVKEDTDVPWELKMLEKKWLEILQPYGERGYNKQPKN